MKKFFSLVAAVLFAGSMFAATEMTCAEAAAAALGGSTAEATVTGYVTSIKTAWNSQYKNISFWMADVADGGEVFQAFRCACENEADAPAVGDKVKVTGTLANFNGTPEMAAGCTFEMIERASVEPTMDYYVCGSMTSWAPNADYKLVANPANEGEYMGTFAFAAGDEFKVVYSDGATVADENWFPTGMGNNYQIAEDGDYKITFNPAGNVDGWYAGFFDVVKKEAPIVRQYEVAEAIAAVTAGELKDDDELFVHGIITKMEFKGKNFAKYGSVNIYVADATGEEGEFEFYNCYSLEADTFRTSVPAYDAASTQWAQFEEVIDGNDVSVKVGDEVIAFGKFKLFNTTYELNTGCFLTAINSEEQGIEETATDAKAVKVVRNGQVYILRGDKTFNLIGAEVK